MLRQDLKRHHVFATASICTLCDILLIALGVGGLGTLITVIPALTAIATWGGAAFLLFYGFRSFRSAIAASAGLNAENALTQPVRLQGAVLAALTFSLLNPHVYYTTASLLAHLFSYSKLA